MAATNTSETQGGKTYYKLKEVEAAVKEKGEYRFFKQVKTSDKWGDGETFDTLSGEVVKVETKDYEYQGEKKKALVVGIEDGIDYFEFSLGFRAMTAQGILNTLAGNNPMKLYFVCGRPKESNGKYYPTLYINKDGGTNEEKRTAWKYAPAQLPKVTTETDEDGNKIKKGVKAADEFWLNVVSEIQQKLKGNPVKGGQLKPNNDFETEKAPVNNTDGDDLPF